MAEREKASQFPLITGINQSPPQSISKNMMYKFLTLIAALVCTFSSFAADSPSKPLPPDPNFFPIAVWLQSPSKAEQYRKAGINTYVGLWRGPTEDQLATLKKAGLKLICH